MLSWRACEGTGPLFAPRSSCTPGFATANVVDGPATARPETDPDADPGAAANGCGVGAAGPDDNPTGGSAYGSNGLEDGGGDIAPGDIAPGGTLATAEE